MSDRLSLQQRNDTLSTSLISQKDYTDSLVTQVAELKSTLLGVQSGLPADEVAVKSYWDNKYPKVYVSYAGDTRTELQADGKSYGMTVHDLPVTTWVTPNGFFAQQMQEMGLTLDSYLKKYPNRLEAYDRLAFDIKDKVVDNMRVYANEQVQWDAPEVWRFPIEVWFDPKDDCEEWALLTASLWASAGLPSYRFRVVAGTVGDGEGHCTTYWLARDNHFHHLNSTSSSKDDVPSQDVVNAPLPGASGDLLGIQNVWFSFNQDYSWHAFESPAAAASFAANNQGGFVKIGGV